MRPEALLRATLWAALALGAARVFPRVGLKDLFSSFGAGAGGGRFAGTRKHPSELRTPDFRQMQPPLPADLARPRLQLGADHAALRAAQDQLRQAEAQRIHIQQIQLEQWNQHVRLQQQAAQSQAQNRYDAWSQNGRR